MRIVFVGAFDWKSTNFSQRKALKATNIDVVSYSYRDRKNILGIDKRDDELIEFCKNVNPEFVLISKGNTINIRVIHAINKFTKTVLWFMDAPIHPNWDGELEEKVKYCSFVVCEKYSAILKAKQFNKNVFQAIEGFDPEIHLPVEIKQDIDISFIGNIYGDRKQNLPENTNIITNAYGLAHSEYVSRSKININLCTQNTASDRVYKILAAKGFLLTNDWDGRIELFEDKQDLVVFKDKQDLDQKIQYFLLHDEERKKIAEQGHQTVQKFTKFNWARNLINIVTEGTYKQKLASYIIVYRESDSNRRKSLEIILEHISNLNLEIIVVEQDTKQHFKNSLFVYNSRLFNRSWGFNIGANKSTCDKLIFADCDILVNHQTIINSLLELDKFQAIDPKGTVIDLQQNETIEKNSKVERTGLDFAGGIVFIKRDAFFKIKGWDEDLKGWGFEDNVMSQKIKRMISHNRAINTIYHLYHERINIDQIKNEKFYKDNLEIFNKIKSFSRQELCQYYAKKLIGKI